ncbi:MAG: hypothetical protein PHT88_05695 [Candidatus Moranbacteria bacterium]|nr:hypothetical protein [Candidatus Moranbacteria bacterium]
MQFKMKYRLILFLLIPLTVFASEKWTVSEFSRTLPGQEDNTAQTFFGSKFTKIRGEYRAMYDSMLETKDTVKGEFLVGKFKYKYKEPIGELNSQFEPLHDEYISEVLLDCNQNFSGTLSETFILHGKTVKSHTNQKSEILMVQLNLSDTTMGDLCAFAKTQAVK